MDLEKTLLRKVGEAIHRFQMIRNGDRVAVADVSAEIVLLWLPLLALAALRVHLTQPASLNIQRPG